MLDSILRPVIDPPLNKFAHKLSTLPLTPNIVTVFGFCLGVAACIFIFLQQPLWALLFLILNRLADGLDGPVARARNQSSDFGGYLDILLDFMIYAGFPFAAAIGIGTPQSLTAGAFVLFSIIGTGVSFLAYAIICAKRGMETSAQGTKTFYFSNGLMEGTETIIFLILLCLFPQYFTIICFVFGGLCCLTTLQRIRMAKHVFQ